MPEIAVTMSIAAFMTAMAIPRFSSMMRSNQLDDITRTLMQDVKRTRALAAAGKTISEGPPRIRAQFAGIRIDSPYRYSIFIDPDDDSQNVDTIDVHTVDLGEYGGEANVRVLYPVPGSQIRFSKDGGTTAVLIVVADLGKHQKRVIEVTAGGQTRVRPYDDTKDD